MPAVRTMSPFTPLFDRSVPLCAEAQTLLRQSVTAVHRVRALRSASRRAQALVEEGRRNLAVAEILFDSLRRELERVVTTMRAAGLDQSQAAATVRARVRFVLYDEGFREAEAEPVVDRATTWVRELFEAA